MRPLSYLLVAALLPGPFHTVLVQAQNHLPPGTRAPDSVSQPQHPSQRDEAENKIDQKDFEGARPLLVSTLAKTPATPARGLISAMSRMPAAIRMRPPSTIAKPLPRTQSSSKTPGAGAPAGPPGQIRRSPGTDTTGEPAEPGATQPNRSGGSLPDSGQAGPHGRSDRCPGCSGCRDQAQPRDPV